MFFSKLAKPVAAALALSFAASNLGCATPDAMPGGGSSESNVSQTKQPFVGIVFGIFNAGFQVAGMLQNYRDRGTLMTGNGEVIDAVKNVQGDLTKLKTQASSIEAAVIQSNITAENLRAIQTSNAIERLWAGYLVADAKGPEVRKAYLQKIATDSALQGSLQWSDLDTLNDLVEGANGSSSLLSLIEESEERKGEAGIANGTLNTWYAQKVLVLEEGYALLAAASENAPGIDLAQEAKNQTARRQKQDAAFMAATRKYNVAIINQVRSARSSQVTMCSETDVSKPGWIQWTYRDNLRGVDSVIESGEWRCLNNRDIYLAPILAALEPPVLQKLWDAEPLFDLMNLSGSYVGDAGTIVVSIKDAQTLISTVSWAPAYPQNMTLESTRGEAVANRMVGPQTTTWKFGPDTSAVSLETSAQSEPTRSYVRR
jgi:hypothetical protein